MPAWRPSPGGRPPPPCGWCVCCYTGAKRRSRKSIFIVKKWVGCLRCVGVCLPPGLRVFVSVYGAPHCLSQPACVSRGAAPYLPAVIAGGANVGSYWAKTRFTLSLSKIPPAPQRKIGNTCSDDLFFSHRAQRPRFTKEKRSPKIF